MYCVIQEIQRKKPNIHGHQREIEVYSYDISGKRKYYWQYAGGRFERPILTAYKVSIHESKRQNGVVIKKQHSLTTASYYDLAEYWIGDCFLHSKLDAIAASLDTTTEHLWGLISAKVDPLQERIRAEFEQSEEYRTHMKHGESIERYSTLRAAFGAQYGVDVEQYDYCYDVFGNLMNPAYLDEIKATAQQRERAKRSYQKTSDGTYSGGYDYSKLFGVATGAYTAEDKAHLKKFYKSLSKIYHPDLNPGTDTHAEMVLLNRLKEEWGV